MMHPKQWIDGKFRRFIVHQLSHTFITAAILAVLLLGATQVGALKGVLMPTIQTISSSFTSITYQGRLADTAGNPIHNTNPGIGMTFTLYDSEVGGAALWSETHANVPVTSGLFSVRLGSTNPLDASLLNGDRWLGIQIGTDAEMSPREKLTAVFYAIQAGEAITVRDGSVTTDKIADGAVTLEKMGLGMYAFSGGTNDEPTAIQYNGPTGNTTLDTSTCPSTGWCCNAENTICLGRSDGEDAILEFSLVGARSINCMLVHGEDDVPEQLYYATDSGNGCRLGERCARLSNVANTTRPISTNRSYFWLCGW